MYICNLKIRLAEIAQLVEHDLAKVGVAGSSPVFRSNILPLKRGFFLVIKPAYLGYREYVHCLLPGWWNW
jgi:hypothetical protein